MVLKATQRVRCVECGTYLFSELAAVEMRSVSPYLLPQEAFKPQCHVNARTLVLPVVDSLPHYKGFPASFGGAEEFLAR